MPATPTTPAFSVLFVCMGNICRSPTAHGVFRDLVHRHHLTKQVKVVSAGTHAYHVGAPPDDRSQAHASRRGYNLSDLRAQHLADADFAAHDLILVMDDANMRAVQARCPGIHQTKLRRLTDFCTSLQAHAVPDPYYGGSAGFEEVLDIVEDACRGLLAHVQMVLAPPRR